MLDSSAHSVTRSARLAQGLVLQVVASWLLSILVLGAHLPAQQTPPADLLDLGSGAALLRFSSEYATDWKAEWSALALLDGTTRLGWCSREGAPLPHEFIVELATVHRVESLTLFNSDNQEASQPGISTRAVEIHTSVDAPDSGFQLAASSEIERGGHTTINLEPPREVRWIKIVIRSNWGHPRYTELMELEATVTAVEVGNPSAKSATTLAGVYEGQYEGQILRTSLTQRGADMTGCYSGAGEGRLSGHVAGRSAELEWRQPIDGGGGLNGSLLLVASDTGSLSGLWYGRGDKSHLVGRWTGQRTAESRNVTARECPAEDLATALDWAGQATLYGIRFTSDSARLTVDAEPTLRQLQSLLVQDTDLRLRIEGHTDSVASTRHNQELSQRRADAVHSWLVDQGIDAGRLAAIGHGEAQPVADNGTSQGRRLNRRVEVVKIPKAMQ